MIQTIAFITAFAPAVAFAQISSMGVSGGDAPRMIMREPKMTTHGRPLDQATHGMTAAPSSRDKARSRPFTRSSGF
jgi:hypothetical protein